MPWDHPSSQADDDAGIDRLGLASPLLGATGWIDGLARLIAIDTSTAPGSYSHAFAGVLQDMFAPLGFSFRRMEVPKSMLSGTESQPRINMIAGRRTGRRVCTVYFHTDTLPPGDGWTRPPFALSRQGSRLYGRGTADMKGAIAAVWSALRAADAVGLGLRFDPVLLFCTDEEGGLYPGLRHMAAQGLVEGHVMCLNGPAAPRIWGGSPGRIDITIHIEARHGTNSRGNPVEAAARLTARLAEMRGEAGGDLAVSSIKGGGKGMANPALCLMTVTCSYAPEENFEALRARVMALVAEAASVVPNFHVRPELTGHRAPVVAPDAGPHWPRWKQALSWGFGYSPDSFRRAPCREASAMGFVQQAGVQEILLGGLGRPNSHRGEADEFTTIEDVEALARSVLAYFSDVPDIPHY